MTRDDFSGAVRTLLATPVDGCTPSDKTKIVRDALATLSLQPEVSSELDGDWTTSSRDEALRSLIVVVVILATIWATEGLSWVQVLAVFAGFGIVALLRNVVRLIRPKRPERC